MKKINNILSYCAAFVVCCGTIKSESMDNNFSRNNNQSTQDLSHQEFDKYIALQCLINEIDKLSTGNKHDILQGLINGINSNQHIGKKNGCLIYNNILKSLISCIDRLPSAKDKRDILQSMIDKMNESSPPLEDKQKETIIGCVTNLQQIFSDKGSQFVINDSNTQIMLTQKDQQLTQQNNQIEFMQDQLTQQNNQIQFLQDQLAQKNNEYAILTELYKKALDTIAQLDDKQN